MIPQTTLLYAATALTLSARTVATYTNADDFIANLPKCIRDCNMAQYNSISENCSTKGFGCFCLAFQAAELDENDLIAKAGVRCSLACPMDEQKGSQAVILEFAQSCLPYFSGGMYGARGVACGGADGVGGAADDGTSGVSSVVPRDGISTMVSSRGSTASSGLSSMEGSVLGVSTTTGSDTPTSTVSDTGAAETGTGSVLGVNALVAVAVPAVLAGLFL